MNRVVSRLVGGLTLGVATALITHYRDERKFEPDLREKAKTLEAKWSNDGAVLADKLNQAKLDAKKLASEN